MENNNISDVEKVKVVAAEAINKGDPVIFKPAPFRFLGTMETKDGEVTIRLDMRLVQVRQDMSAPGKQILSCQCGCPFISTHPGGKTRWVSW